MPYHQRRAATAAHADANSAREVLAQIKDVLIMPAGYRLDRPADRLNLLDAAHRSACRVIELNAGIQRNRAWLPERIVITRFVTRRPTRAGRHRLHP